MKRQPDDSVLAVGKGAISASCVQIEKRAIKWRGVEVMDCLSRRLEGLDQQGPVARRRKTERSIAYRSRLVFEYPGLRKGAGFREVV